MASEARVSIALCTYNGAAYLSEQLDSYLTQTRLPDELVVNDDGSQDDTLALLHAFAARAPFPVRIEQNPHNLGTVRNFDRAIARCEGDILFLSDQDDWWFPNKIERVLDAFRGRPEADLVFADAELVDAALQPLGRYLYSGAFTPAERAALEAGRVFPLLLRGYLMIGASMAFRARCRARILPIPTDIPGTIHDGWIAAVAAAAAPVVYVDAALIRYRQHAAQQTGVHNYGPVVSRLAWRDAMVRVEREQRLKREFVESLRRQLLAREGAMPEARASLAAEIATRAAHEQHYRVRANLPARKPARLGPVLRELATGRYHRFSNGLRSAARDLASSEMREVDFHEIADRRGAA
jgi:glycosyltransferase involved in cell wall biosynthesis